MPDGPAAGAGLLEGDRIIRLHETEVDSRHDLNTALRHLKAGDKITLVVVREGEDREITVVLGDLGTVHGEPHAGQAYLGVGLDPGEPYPEGRFVPSTFDITRSIELDGSPEEVFPLFEPVHQAHLLKLGKATVLYVPPDGKKRGTVVRIARTGSERGQVWTIDHYDPKARVIRYSIHYGEVETEKLYIRCKKNAYGRTTATVREIIMGLNNYGNDAVEEYVHAGMVEKSIEALGKAINEHLEKSRKE